MTEAEWMACENPAPMLALLKGKVSERKLRLFATGCCRRIWDLLTDPRSREAVEVAERYADERCNEEDLARAALEALVVRRAAVALARQSDAAWAEVERMATEVAESVTVPLAFDAAQTVLPLTEDARVGLASWERGWLPPWDQRQQEIERLREARGEQRLAQCDMLRCIFGNPIRRPPAIDPECLNWNDGTVPRIARGIYEERAFDCLPILADALLDAGCDDEELLAHLRSPGPHVRGCWAVDLILGKE